MSEICIVHIDGLDWVYGLCDVGQSNVERM